MSKQTQLFDKYGGEPTEDANLEYITKAERGELNNGWSRLVLKSMAENYQSHLYTMLKPSLIFCDLKQI